MTVEIRKSAPPPSAREPTAGSGSGKPASARPRSCPCGASGYLQEIQHHELACYCKALINFAADQKHLAPGGSTRERACGGV